MSLSKRSCRNSCGPLLFVTALVLCHLQLWPQTLSKQFPSASGPSSLPDAPGFPVAEVVPAPPQGVSARLESKQQEKHGSVYILTDDVRIDYKDYTLTADKVSYDDHTKDAEADGHVRLQGKQNNELILADHGTFNFDLETGRFENVTGSVGRQPSASKRKLVYTTTNPFLFTGRVLIKEGPERYQIFQGTMTSCLLPDPDWRIHASQIRVNYGEASAKNSYFTLLGVPILYLPYVTHPVSTETRETGLLIPAFTLFSSTKGTVVGDSIYLVFNRSMDLTIGTQYFSKRGWSPSGEFRYHGREDDFGDARFTALFDRGLTPTFINEGGQDIVVNGRHDFDPDERTRAVANGEYLSSYVYRQSFAESFAQGIASQVQSLAFITHNVGGVSSSVRFDRYQNFEGMTLVGNTYDTPQISILRLPSLDFDTVDRAFGPSALGAALEWGVDGSAAGLSRSEPGYATGEVGRFDLYPHLSLPLHLDGWTLRPEVGARETYYTQSQIPTNTTPVLGNAPVNRSDLEASFELRPPALVRDFKAPVLERLFDSDLRHTIEPEIQYRFVAGVNNFSSIPRFDSTDVVSDTNEVEYSLTQRLFFRHLHRKPCRSGDLPKPLNGIIYIPWDYTECGGDTNEWITWRLAAKYFFDPTFGGAIPPPQTNRNSILYATPTFLPFRRTVLTSALDLTGVAFLGEPRNDSPLISRFKARTSEHTDFEWDADYDFKNHRLDASNLFADYRRDSVFGSIGYSTLQALNGSFTSNSASQVTQYSLIRLLMGYGAPTKRGFSTAVNGGYNLTQDALQYAGIETSYNLDCCGLVIEYRRLVLGTVPTENEYRFSITLAGVGAAGNLAHSERIF
jgi:LPS-assembly protein